ncbi:hypothetical protein HRbin06_00489 [archaeon HR06]|nr:hypothetical protein HRbin06_00489 [archaeon HR06]
MKRGREEDTSYRKEVMLSLVLRLGVISSVAIIILGVILMILTGHSGYGAGFDIAKLLYYDESKIPHRFYPTNLQTILNGLLSLKPFAIIDFGLIVLIATPILRVGMSIILFGIEGDKKYIIITSLVFTILILSILIV